MNLAAHQENAYQAIINVTVRRIVPIIAMKTDVTTEATEMEVMQIALNKEMKVLFTFPQQAPPTSSYHRGCTIVSRWTTKKNALS